jgi:uncharacterized protein
MKFILGISFIIIASASLAQQKPGNMEPGNTLQQKVNFDSEGEKISGNLLLPAGYKEGQRLPVIIVVGPWTQVKEQVQYFYGRKLAKQGYAVLNFDFRNWGESGGKPRFYESPNEKVKDVLNAVQFLKTHPAIDASSISLIGVCAGAGIALKVTAQSKDIRRTATVAAWLQHPSSTPLFYGGEEGVQRRIALAEAAQKKYEQKGEVDYVEAYNPNDPAAAMFFPIDYYGNKNRGRKPAWTNQFAVMGWKEWMSLNAIDGIAEIINRPVIMVHSDGSALPDNVKRFYNLMPSKNRKLAWLEGEHTQFYDDDAHVDAAIAEISSFFKAAQNMATNGNSDSMTPTREKNLGVIKLFFELLHQKNAAAWADLWDENGLIYIPYPVANFPDTIKTRKTILEGFEKLLSGFKSFDYHIKEIYPTVDPDVIVVEYTVEAVLVKTGATYNGINLAIFKFRNGKIVAYHDYFNPEKFKKVIEAISQ